MELNVLRTTLTLGEGDHKLVMDISFESNGLRIVVPQGGRNIDILIRDYEAEVGMADLNQIMMLSTREEKLRFLGTYIYIPIKQVGGEEVIDWEGEEIVYWFIGKDCLLVPAKFFSFLYYCINLM